MNTKPTERFSNRVADYIKYRPGYPDEALDFLGRELDLTPQSVIADVGSGTGKLTEMLLARGHTVHAVEPNAEMRTAAEQLLSSNSKFYSHAGASEATTLPDSSVDAIVAAQAFHWFDAPQAKIEFARILKPAGRVALIWNNRPRDTTDPFLLAYERFLLRHCGDYESVASRYAKQDDIASFFSPMPVSRASFPHRQAFDYPSLEGRLRSSSYFPLTGQQHAKALAGLRDIFDAHQHNGVVNFLYTTEVFHGPFKPPAP